MPPPPHEIEWMSIGAKRVLKSELKLVKGMNSFTMGVKTGTVTKPLKKSDPNYYTAYTANCLHSEIYGATFRIWF